MSAFDDYLAQLRRLDEVRRGFDEAASRSASRVESLGERAGRLTAQAAEQREAVDELARAARVPIPPRTRAGDLDGDPAVEVNAAEADLRAAATEFEEARYLAHRAPWLPHWRTDERNGLLYGMFALASLLVQLIVLRVVKADDLTGAVVLAAIIVACPLAAFAAGWLTIGVTSRPRIGDQEEKLERNFRLGLALCGSTLAVSCLGFFS
ncbi:hypothetical protein GCM10027447_31730 [Glycomyces halotolerans]